MACQTLYRTLSHIYHLANQLFFDMAWNITLSARTAPGSHTSKMAEKIGMKCFSYVVFETIPLKLLKKDTKMVRKVLVPIHVT